MDVGTQLARSHEISVKIGLIRSRRMETARKQFVGRMQAAVKGEGADPGSPSQLFLKLWASPWSAASYAADAAQRSILFWDTLRERGNAFVEQAFSGLEPVLHFEYDIVLDGRDFERPVNYAMVRIRPPEGVTVDPKRRPYLIIDPRAGHGPGIGGFKDDSQVGVALRGGHPVYFVIFFRDPEPGQTLLDVTAAEQQFVKKTRELHPDSPKPAIIGNCQGGWAAMMLAASDTEDTGPIVINGAPMSYWGGAWSEGEGDNPMRYAGGLLGGSWLASFMADLGNGIFDGAWLVKNFEGLNPANTLWDKYYHLYANIDTEPPRYLEFERWWGGYYLMNREEIEWITRNLFVGNKLWSGDVESAAGKTFDLREITSPIILFASMGDNITPPQQAFNWVGDMYGSTEEIKARGQVIVGLMHRDVGHLGIFVSGKVAKKEHAQIVSVLQSIEALPPGLYGMQISERRGSGGAKEYEVEFREHQLEEVTAHFNRFGRTDEKPFEAVAAISDFNQRAYELFVQPLVQSMANEWSAHLLREFHPLRFQRWAFSNMNPWLAWLGPAAEAVRTSRGAETEAAAALGEEEAAPSAWASNPWLSWLAPATGAFGGMGKAVDANNPLREAEKIGSELISASLDYYRAVRDATTEARFFAVYANMFSLYLADRQAEEGKAQIAQDPRELPFVKEALASIAEGAYPEAYARIAFLLTRKGEPLPLSRLAARVELAKDYADYLPSVPPEQLRRIRAEQGIIVRYEPERAITTLPALLTDQADRERLLTLLDKLMADKRVQNAEPTAEQLAMHERIRAELSERPARSRRLAAVRR